MGNSTVFQQIIFFWWANNIDFNCKRYWFAEQMIRISWEKLRKNGANHNRLGQIRIAGTNTVITESDNLANITIDSGCYIDGSIIGSIYIKKLEGNFIAIPDDIELIDKQIQAQIGIRYSDNTIEYICIVL